jgi:hypothetical protein
MDVRRAVQSVRGAGARSVKVHGIVVYLDKELTLPKPNSQTRLAPTPAPESASSAAAMRLDDAPTTSKQRRSRRRLQQRIEQRAAAQVQERPTQPPAADDDGLAAMRAAMLRTQSAAEQPDASNLFLPDPRSPEEVPGGQGEGGPTRAELWPTPAKCGKPAATMQSTGRAVAATRRKGDRGSSPMQIDATARGSREPVGESLGRAMVARR